MNFPIRALPVTLSLISTLVMLFGGWFLYQQFYVQKPIEAFIEGKKHIVLNDLQIQNDTVIVDLDFKNGDQFAADYQEINQFIMDKTGGKKVQIRLPEQGEELKRVWTEEYFELEEAIQKQEYSRIPSIIEEIKRSKVLENTMTSMDKENIYIYLQKGSDHLYAVLPRKPLQGGDINE
jgi:hypothetical protein